VHITLFTGSGFMTPEEFTALISSITARLDGRRLDQTLAAELEDAFPAGGAKFDTVFAGCRDAVAAGWMCNREAGGIRYGRVVKPGPATHGFSVDVVEMENVVGPHHAHPNGEIDLVMPITESAKFDGHGAGWVVYGPGSAHRPTVSDGKALVLYLLPQGAIEFSKT
jgi:uncharacterized protein DUF4863